ncbi:unnamed protein product [Ectocarpus sp. 4 AP-2014]
MLPAGSAFTAVPYQIPQGGVFALDDKQTMGRDCKEAARALYACMKKTQCMKDGGRLKECLKTSDREFCRQDYQSFFECKRGQLDMRTRIRGERSF